MSNYIKGRAGLKKMEINAVTFFNHMTDDDFMHTTRDEVRGAV